jgi:hypothetical protein
VKFKDRSAPAPPSPPGLRAALVNHFRSSAFRASGSLDQGLPMYREFSHLDEERLQYWTWAVAIVLSLLLGTALVLFLKLRP